MSPLTTEHGAYRQRGVLIIVEHTTNVALFDVSCEQPFWRKRNAQAAEDHFTDGIAAVAGDVAFDSHIELSCTVLEVPGVIVLQQRETDAVVACQVIGLAWQTV